MTRRLDLTRVQILAFRRRVQGLDTRLPPSARSLRRAAWAGLQDSMPRAALLSMHARVEGVTPTSWEAPSLAQVWGPRHHAYVVAASDTAVFSLGRWPDGAASQRAAETLAARLARLLAGRTMPYGQAGRELAEPANRLRYAALTGTVRMRWDGARQPVIWTVPSPDMTHADARLELARRYLHLFGPTTAPSFAQWAGISPRAAATAFATLERALIGARTPTGDAWLLASDEPVARTRLTELAGARLLPSGDTFFLLHGAERALLVPDVTCRGALWTSRVWPGALLVGGEIVGTWRRAGTDVSIQSWRRLSRPERQAIEAEVVTLPLPDGHARVVAMNRLPL